MLRPRRAVEDWRVTVLDYTRYEDRNRSIHHPVPDPTWEQSREAIRSLDGGRQSDLSIQAANGNILCVDGGRGRYTVETQIGRHSRTGVAATLVNPAGRDAIEGGVVIGGCRTLLPERYIVDLTSARRRAGPRPMRE